MENEQKRITRNIGKQENKMETRKKTNFVRIAKVYDSNLWNL